MQKSRKSRRMPANRSYICEDVSSGAHLDGGNAAKAMIASQLSENDRRETIRQPDRAGVGGA